MRIVSWSLAGLLLAAPAVLAKNNRNKQNGQGNGGCKNVLAGANVNATVDTTADGATVRLTPKPGGTAADAQQLAQKLQQCLAGAKAADDRDDDHKDRDSARSGDKDHDSARSGDKDKDSDEDHDRDNDRGGKKKQKKEDD